MRSLLYALVLIAVIAGTILLLRPSEERRDRPPPDRRPLVSSEAPAPAVIDRIELGAADEDELYMIGDEFLRMWHVREATEVFELAVARDSTRYDVLVRLVECYSHPLLEREDDARAVWDRAMRVMPAPEDSLFLLGLRDLYIDRDYFVAIERLKRARREEVSHPDAAYYLALAFLDGGRPDLAESLAGELLSADDTEGRVLELYVRSLAAEGNLDEASDRARDLARLYAEEPFPYVLLALVELQRGHFEEAVRFCNNALVLDARYIPAIVCRGTLYAHAGKVEAARVSFEKLLLFEDPVLRAIGYEGSAYASFIEGDFGRGVDAMDEAVRSAILAGSVRRGMSYVAGLVNYLCELGEGGAAEEVVDRWLTGFGEIPEALGRMRIDVLAGRYGRVRRSLNEMRTEKEWRMWARVLDVDPVELDALTEIGENRFERAIYLLEEADVEAAYGTALARRAFVRAYALFESGNAEAARAVFGEVRDSYYTTGFPYRSDPVLYVQSLFYLAECALAAGNETEAAADYRAFLSSWGDARWELRAVKRAREKMRNLGGAEAVPQQSGG